MQKYKKILVSLCVAVLLFNIVSPVVLATNEPYDHEALMQYDGYGKAMYETIVDETSFITGQYTENKNFVSDSIDQIRDYAKFWWNEQNWESEPWTYERFKEMVAKPTGYLLTVGDWVGKLFGGYGEKYHPPTSSGGAYDKYITFTDNCKPWCIKFQVNKGYVMIIAGERFTYESGFMSISTGGNVTRNPPWAKLILGVYANDKKVISTDWKEFHGDDAMYFNSDNGGGLVYDRDFGKHVRTLSMFGLSVRFEKDDGTPVTPNLKNPYDKFLNHVHNNMSNVVTPEPRPYLSCPNGSKIQMSVNGSTFLSVDGKAMIVNKDGTAEVDSAICKLGWDKPVIKYIDNRAAIQTPDGKWKDAETGEMLDGNGGNGDGEGECGILCSIGKLAQFALDFFEKLLDFFIKIFIPEDMDFISKEFDKLKNTFDEKLGIVGDLGGSIKDLFSQENSNQLDDLTISLPATGGKPIKVVEMSFIEQHVPTVKKVMSGILVLITVFYVYRKITGRGGVMEK